MTNDKQPEIDPLFRIADIAHVHFDNYLIIGTFKDKDGGEGIRWKNSDKCWAIGAATVFLNMIGADSEIEQSKEKNDE